MSERERYKRWASRMQPALTTLRTRGFRPARARLIETLAAMTEVDPRWLQRECERTSFEGMLHTLGVVTDRARGPEYWERLCAREIVPLGWLEESERVFFERACDPVITDVRVYEPDRRWSALPVRALDALTLASDPEGVAAVEALARECAARFAVHCGATKLRVHWSVLRNGGATEQTSIPDATALPEGLTAAVRAPASMLGERWSDKLTKQLDLADPALRTLLANDNTRARTSHWYLRVALAQIGHDAAWRELASEDAALTPRDAGSLAPLLAAWSAQPERTYASVANPFEPMAAIIERGYLLEAIKPDGLWLYAPSL